MDELAPGLLCLVQSNSESFDKVAPLRTPTVTSKISQILLTSAKRFLDKSANSVLETTLMWASSLKLLIEDNESNEEAILNVEATYEVLRERHVDAELDTELTALLQSIKRD